MTIDNKLSTLTFDSLYLLTGHYLYRSLSLTTVIASANVPPQGKNFPVSRDQMRMGEREYSKKALSTHLYLICKW